MDFSEEKSSQEMGKYIPVLSECAKNLKGHLKEWYIQKISVVGVDLASLPKEQFESENLPQINRYLVLETRTSLHKRAKHNHLSTLNIHIKLIHWDNWGAHIYKN